MKQNLPVITLFSIFRKKALQHFRSFSLVTLLSSSFLVSQAQGAGTALAFDGVDDYVSIPSLTFNSSYTKEAWVYWTGNNSTFYNIVSGQNTAFWINNGFLSAGHNSAFTEIQDPTPFTPNVWTHVALTYDAGTNELNLYKNGILVAGPVIDMSAISETQQQIGAYFDGSFYVYPWVGNIDEVKVWDIALTQTQIRDNMCKTVTSSDPAWANLMAYYKADENTGTTLGDSKNANDGTLQNGLGWITSGAAIGDDCVHDFVNATKTATITYSTTGESFTATETSGAPDAIYVYLVKGAPTNATGITGLGGNDKYFGVFQVGGTSPTYTGTYYYSTIMAQPNETDLLLFKRANNADPTWVNSGATQNTTAKTMTLTGESTEYILGSAGFALPVTLSSFTAAKNKAVVNLSWTTATESNNAGFYVQRSVNGGVSWSDLGFVPGNGNSSTVKQYSFVDGAPLKGNNYYRIKQVDIDGHFKLSYTRVINIIGREGIFIYPVPAAGSVTIDINKDGLINTEASLIDVQGKILKKFIIANEQQQLSLDNVTKGIYFVKFADGSVVRISKQ